MNQDKKKLNKEIDKDYGLISMLDIEDEAKELALRWVEGIADDYQNNISNKHKLVSDVMNYARRSREGKVSLQRFMHNPTGVEHRLKTWNKYFMKVWELEKTFEIRKNDRDYKNGDRVVLLDYDPELDTCSGMRIIGEITYVFNGGILAELNGVDFGYCVFSMRIIDRIMV